MVRSSRLARASSRHTPPRVARRTCRRLLLVWRMRIVVRAGRYRRAIPSRVLRTGRDTTPVGSTSPASKTTTGRASGVAWTPRRSVGKRARRATRSRNSRAPSPSTNPSSRSSCFLLGWTSSPRCWGASRRGRWRSPRTPQTRPQRSRSSARSSQISTPSRATPMRASSSRRARTPPHTPPRARASPSPTSSTAVDATKSRHPEGEPRRGPFDGFPSSASSARATARSRADSTASSRREQVHRSPSTATFVSRPPTRSPASLSCSTRRARPRPRRASSSATRTSRITAR